MRHQKKFLIRCLSLFILLSISSATFAQEGKFYLGLLMEANHLDMSYKKATDNTDPRNTSLQAGRIYRSSDSTGDMEHGFGFLAGYRMPLNAKGLYLDSEIDVSYRSGSLSSYFRGAGDSPTRNQYGENWPERWTFEQDEVYGVTFKLGGRPEFMQSLIGDDTSVYALAGMRRIKTQFRLDFTGCPVPTPCQAGGFITDSLVQNPYTTAWTGGVGLERKFSEKAVLRGELRYTELETINLLSLPDDGRIRVDAEVDGDEVGLSLKLVRFF